MAAINGNFAKEGLGFCFAEGASMLVSLGVVAMGDQVAPGAIHSLGNVVSKTLIKPNLPLVEKALSYCKLEECRPDPKDTPDQRADRLGYWTVLFGASWVAGMVAKLQTRRIMNRSFGIHDVPQPKADTWWQWCKNQMPTKKEAIILSADDITHYALLGWINTSGAEYTDDMIKATGNMLTKSFGLSPQKAHEVAAYTMIWEMPNLLGLGAGLGAIYAAHKYPRALGLRPMNGHASHLAAAEGLHTQAL